MDLQVFVQNSGSEPISHSVRDARGQATEIEIDCQIGDGMPQRMRVATEPGSWTITSRDSSSHEFRIQLNDPSGSHHPGSVRASLPSTVQETTDNIVATISMEADKVSVVIRWSRISDESARFRQSIVELVRQAGLIEQTRANDGSVFRVDCRAIAMQLEQPNYVPAILVRSSTSVAGESRESRIQRVADSILNTTADRRLLHLRHPIVDYSQGTMAAKFLAVPVGRRSDPGIPAMPGFPPPPPSRDAPAWPTFAPQGRIFELLRHPSNYSPSMLMMWIPTHHHANSGSTPSTRSLFTTSPTNQLIYNPLARTDSIDYHIVFTPVIPSDHWGRYPNGRGYVDLAARYLGHNAERHDFPFYFQIIDQHAIENRDVVLVLAVPSRLGYYRGLQSQTDLMRLLREIHQFLERTVRRSFRLGRVALSGFSRGTLAIDQILQTPGGNAALASELVNQHLRELYSFDGVGSSAISFCSWFAQDRENRMLRVYANDEKSGTDWLQPMLSTLPQERTVYSLSQPAASRGRVDRSLIEEGFVHVESVAAGGGATLCWMSANRFLRRVVDFPSKSNDGALHKVIPSLFVAHAISRSGFRPI